MAGFDTQLLTEEARDVKSKPSLTTTHRSRVRPTPSPWEECGSEYGSPPSSPLSGVGL